jgi:hypothetical protein
MTLTSPPGESEGGFALLRSLVILFAVLVCFAGVAAGIAGYVRNAGRLETQALRATEKWNAETERIIAEQ